MSYIYLKVTIEKNWRSQNFDFLSLKNSSPGQILGSSTSCRYHWILKLNSHRSVCGFSMIFVFKEIMTL